MYELKKRSLGEKMELPVADEIKRIRVELGLTQKVASQLIYVSLNCWQKYEKGTRKISPAAWELFRLKTGLIKLEKI